MSGSVSLMKWPRVVLYGDSLTQFGFGESGCWISKIADHLQRKCDVLNRGFSGYNTSWNKIMLPRLITREDVPNIAAFTVFLGANDSNLPECVQHVPVEDYKNNLKSMVKYLESIGLTKEQLILIGPPPCDDKAWLAHQKSQERESFQDNEYKQQYAVGCRQVAADTGVAFVDLYLDMMKIENWGCYFEDGLHLSKEGSQFLASALLPHIEKLTEHLPVIMPDWKEVDLKDPEQSLL